MNLIETIIHKLPAGKYIIVDPAEVLWIDDYTDLEKAISLSNYSGEIVSIREHEILVFKTTFNTPIEDYVSKFGILIDDEGYQYNTQNGFFAVIPLKACEEDLLDIALKHHTGRVISTDNRFLCFNDDGYVSIGNVIIDNRPK